MKYLCIRETYTDNQGRERVSWNRIGFLFSAKGKEYIKLYHIPNTLISIFEPKPKKEAPPLDEDTGWMEE